MVTDYSVAGSGGVLELNEWIIGGVLAKTVRLFHENNIDS